MTIQEHSQNLGGLLANFHSLEFMLRAFLHKHNPDEEKWANGMDVYNYEIGTKLPENSFTNFDSLGQLIKKYNAIAQKNSIEEIDTTLVDLRDAIAHGRTSTYDDNKPFRLIKFSPPIKGQVEVVFNCVMTLEWYKVQKQRVIYAIMLVTKGPNDSYLLV